VSDRIEEAIAKEEAIEEAIEAIEEAIEGKFGKKEFAPPYWSNKTENG
jgi:20S proteasome alpha/beta subunit